MLDSIGNGQVTTAFLAVGVVVLALGLPLLIGGLWGYFVVLPEFRDSVSEAALEMGLTDIPGVSHDSLSRFFAQTAAIGMTKVAIGAALVGIALSRVRKTRGA